MKAEFIQTCITDSKLVSHYETKGWMKAGRAIKKAIINLNFAGYEFFTKKVLNSYYVKVERMKFEGKLYAIVTHSATNYFFEINPSA